MADKKIGYAHCKVISLCLWGVLETGRKNLGEIRDAKLPWLVSDSPRLLYGRLARTQGNGDEHLSRALGWQLA